MQKNKYLLLFSLGLFLIPTGVMKVDAQPPLETGKAPALNQTTVKVWVTAYASVPEMTDDTPFITASNQHVRDGIVAANFLPFGTLVQIPKLFGNKIFVVEDRMSRRKTNFIDVWMPTKEATVLFGIHQAEVVILNLKDQRSIPQNLLVLK